MRSAAMVLGIIAGIIGMIVGFFSFGYTEAEARESQARRTEAFHAAGCQADSRQRTVGDGSDGGRSVLPG